MEYRNGKKAALHNLGCKVNAYETEAMEQKLEQAGYEIVPFAPGADVYVINTCSVTNIADRKSRQMLHKAKKLNPQAVVVAAGCYVQTAKERTGLAVEADIILGNNKKKDLLEALEEFEQQRRRESGDSEKEAACLEEAVGQKENSDCRQRSERVIDINHTGEYEQLFLSKTQEHTRAYIKVQDGCNQFCSYCIIPYARGRARSREMEEVLKELKTLADTGVKEVVLTGIHLSSYGKDLGSSLLELIQAVHRLPGIERIRLGSLEPGIVTEEFARALSSLPKMCPHFHLSLQSGSDTVLKRMNRRYTADEYAKRCEILRNYFEYPALTTDVIVGFPGETEEEFLETLEFLKKIRFYETHIFKYSKREGTKAAVMPDQVPEQVKTVRSNQLLALNEKKQKEFEQYYLGKSVEVLMEEEIEKEGKYFQTGHTKEYILIAVESEENWQNKLVNVKIDDHLQIIH